MAGMVPPPPKWGNSSGTSKVTNEGRVRGHTPETSLSSSFLYVLPPPA